MAAEYGVFSVTIPYADYSQCRLQGEVNRKQSEIVGIGVPTYEFFFLIRETVHYLQAKKTIFELLSPLGTDDH